MRAAGRAAVLVDTHRAAGDFDVLAFNLSAELVYTNLLNCVDLAGVPVRSERPRADAPARDRRRPLHLQPRAAGRLRRLRSCIGDGEEVDRRDRRGRRRVEARRPRRAARRVLRELATIAGRLRARRCTTSTYDGPTIARRSRPAFADVPARRRQAHRRRPRRLAVPEATSSCRSSRSCTTGSTSRSSAAAPAAAASARPG